MIAKNSQQKRYWW